jgi:hypothetical protein
MEARLMALAKEKLGVVVAVTDVAGAFSEGVLGLDVRSADDYGCMLGANGTTLRLARVDAYERPPDTVAGREVRSLVDAANSLAGAGGDAYRYERMEQDARGIWAVRWSR